MKNRLTCKNRWNHASFIQLLHFSFLWLPAPAVFNFIGHWSGWEKQTDLSFWQWSFMSCISVHWTWLWINKNKVCWSATWVVSHHVTEIQLINLFHLVKNTYVVHVFSCICIFIWNYNDFLHKGLFFVEYMNKLWNNCKWNYSTKITIVIAPTSYIK